MTELALEEIFPRLRAPAVGRQHLGDRRFPLLSASIVVIFQAVEHKRPLASTHHTAW